MKGITTAAGMLALAAALWSPGWADKGHEHSEPGRAQGQAVALTGEVVDLHCYMAHEGKGAKHAKCAKACALEGAPLGLLTDDGKVYLLTEEHARKKPYAKARTLAGERATVEGKLFTRGGLTGIVVAKVEAAAK